MSCRRIPGPITWTTFQRERRGYAPWTVLKRRTRTRSQQGALTLVKRTTSGNVLRADRRSARLQLLGETLRRTKSFCDYSYMYTNGELRGNQDTGASRDPTEDRGSVVPSTDQPYSRGEDDSGKGAKSFHMGAEGREAQNGKCILRCRKSSEDATPFDRGARSAQQSSSVD